MDWFGFVGGFVLFRIGSLPLLQLENLVQADPLFDRQILQQQVDLRESVDAEVIQCLLHPARPDQMSGSKDEQSVGKLCVFQVMSDAKEGDGVFFRILGEKMHDPGITGRIQTAGCLIDNQDARKREQFHGETDPLRLASGEVPDRRVMTVVDSHILLNGTDALDDLVPAHRGG